MPLYYDLTNTRRKRSLHAAHVMIASEFIQLLRRQHYSRRRELPDGVSLAVYDRARRDLEGFIGIRSAAGTAKLEPDEVFA